MLKRADAEHQRTPTPIAEKRAGIDLPQDVMDNIIGNVNERLKTKINKGVEDISSSTKITANDLRELRGSLYAKDDSGEERIKALNIEMDHWKKKSDTEKSERNNNKALLYDAIRKAAELKADQIRLKLN